MKALFAERSCVIPAQAGIHGIKALLDARFHGHSAGGLLVEGRSAPDVSA
jgi:hypothetical protein